MVPMLVPCLQRPTWQPSRAIVCVVVIGSKGHPTYGRELVTSGPKRT
jgi:hypothetical protein